MLENSKCPNCGAGVVYEPGLSVLVCDYCSHEIELDFLFKAAQSKEARREFDLESYLKNYQENHEQVEALILKCVSCGASTELKDEAQLTHCLFCDSSLVLSCAENHKHTKPQGILPYLVGRDAAKKSFSRWARSLFLAPTVLLRRLEKQERFQSVYFPFWTYDCDVLATYDAERGKVSTWNKESIDWEKVSGSVEITYDDLLIPATQSIRSSMLKQLQPWDLEQLVD